MGKPRAGWRVFDAATPVLTYEYSFGPATATALAIGVRDGLAVVSPPRAVTEQAFEELRSFGAVRALVAPNAFHHLGVPAWKARFPEALVFAPAQSVRRVRRKTGIEDVRPLADLPSLLGTSVDFTDMPHYRMGEVLVRADTPRGRIWYVTDVILNLPELPAHPVIRVLFGLTRSAPGLRFNNAGARVMIRNHRALRRWMADEFAKAPPRWIIPAHGEVADLDARPELVSGLFGPELQKQ